MTIDVTTRTISNIKFPSIGNTTFEAEHEDKETVRVTFPCGESDSFALETIKAVVKAADLSELSLDKGEELLEAVALTFKFSSVNADYFAVIDPSLHSRNTVSIRQFGESTSPQFHLSTLNELVGALED